MYIAVAVLFPEHYPYTLWLVFQLDTSEGSVHHKYLGSVVFALALIALSRVAAAAFMTVIRKYVLYYSFAMTVGLLALSRFATPT